MTNAAEFPLFKCLFVCFRWSLCAVSCKCWAIGWDGRVIRYDSIIINATQITIIIIINRIGTSVFAIVRRDRASNGGSKGSSVVWQGSMVRRLRCRLLCVGISFEPKCDSVFVDRGRLRRLFLPCHIKRQFIRCSSFVMWMVLMCALLIEITSERLKCDPILIVGRRDWKSRINGF